MKSTLTLSAFLFLFFLFQPAYAYLDGATVSSVIQMLGAFLIGGVLVFKSSFLTVKNKTKTILSKIKPSK